jgi:hypothetical protein
VDVLGERLRQDAGQLVEGVDHVLIAVILEALHQPRAQEQRDRLVQGELQRGQEGRWLSAEAVAFLPVLDTYLPLGGGGETRYEQDAGEFAGNCLRGEPHLAQHRRGDRVRWHVRGCGGAGHHMACGGVLPKSATHPGSARPVRRTQPERPEP